MPFPFVGYRFAHAPLRWLFLHDTIGGEEVLGVVDQDFAGANAFRRSNDFACGLYEGMDSQRKRQKPKESGGKAPHSETKTSILHSEIRLT
jgi:hypothetical protein